ncbi:MAG: thioredoxin domain-containing protein [Dehalobacterium sp.]
MAGRSGYAGRASGRQAQVCIEWEGWGLTMKPILEPGIKAPEFALPAVNREQEASLGVRSDGVKVIIFFGSEMTGEIAGQLAGYQERMGDFEARHAQIIAVSDATFGELKKLVEDKRIGFPLVSSDSSNGLARNYGVVVNNVIMPVVFVVDQEGLIRRVYHSEPAQGLPNPAMVLRALNNLNNTPKPPLMTGDDWRLGPAEAPVVLIEYGEYQCGHCRDLYRIIMELMPFYQDKIQFIFRHFPMRHLHPLAVPAAEAAEVAGAQGRFWEMHARLFATDKALERENLIQYARELGLDTEKFIADLDGHHFLDAVQEDYRGGVGRKIKSPPTLFINYILFDGTPTVENLRVRIDSLLSCLA